MIRTALTVSLLLAAAPALAEAPITGKWMCDYGVRKMSEAMASSSAWFEVTFSEGGKFHGGGKATAAGTSLPMNLRGTWKLGDDGVLSLIGISEVTNRHVPFRFLSDRVADDRFKRREMKGASEYRTNCKRMD